MRFVVFGLENFENPFHHVTIGKDAFIGTNVWNFVVDRILPVFSRCSADFVVDGVDHHGVEFFVVG